MSSWGPIRRTFLAPALAAALFAPAPAAALTLAHSAASTKATQGDCSGCHIPHRASGAQRLFPAQPSAGSVAVYGFMGAMCAEYCHDQIVQLPHAYAATTALANPGGGATGTAAGSHGLGHIATNAPPNTTVSSVLPYGNDVAGVDSQGLVGFECTTCHNVHKNAFGDTSEALLQLDIDALCDQCHTSRGSGDGAWAGGYGDTNVGGGGTNSTHPVGTNVTTDSSVHDINGDLVGDPDSPIFIGMATVAGQTSFDMPYTQTGSGTHNLGGHLVNGAAKDASSHGPVTCVTCHAVHGRQFDSDTPTPPVGPFEDLLTIQQGTQGTAEPGFAANGNGDAANALCAGCHAHTTLAPDNFNPGATGYSHPANAMPAISNRGVIVGDATAATWPYGTNAAPPLLDLGVICETCHKPHGAFVSSHILRDDEWDICNHCHVGTLQYHHPSGIPMPARMSDPAIGDGDGTLTCSDCHNGNGAHNWSAPGGVGLDPDWEPFDNARATDTALNRFQVNTSKECYDCHSGLNAHPSPTLQNNNAAGTLQNRGEGTHYVGPSANTATHGNLANGWRDGAAFNAFTASWPGGGWSRFGGTNATAYELVCESCHDLEPDKSDNPVTSGNPYNALLLRTLVERQDSPASDLCTGCHGLVPGGSSVHPLTGDSISKAVDMNRATTTLLTGAGSFADAAGAPNLAEYPATPNRMNCDSCHQTHDAPTDSGTFILEYNTGTGTGLAPVGVWGYTITNRAAAGQNIDHDALCTQCHAY